MKLLTRTYVCARCGLRTVGNRLMFSRFTRQRYCMDIDACERRAKHRWAP